MRHLFLAMCTLLLWGCQRQTLSTAQRIAKFKAGDPVSAVVTMMSLEKYESRDTYNLPPGKNSSRYFLPDGDLYLSSENPTMNTDKIDEHAWILSSPLYFEPSQIPAAQRVTKDDEAFMKGWGEYVREHTGK